MINLWDLIVDNILERFFDWIYGQIVAFLGEFLTMLNGMGTEIFEMDWIKAIVQLFSYLGWSLYVVGLVVAVFDTVIEMQNGRGSMRDMALNAIKGFMAAGLFSVLPIELYKYSVTLQGKLVSGIAGLTASPDSISTIGLSIIMNLTFGSGIIMLVFTILIGYSIIKVFFANLKRGGILLTMIAVGSLYMFSVPRGYLDGFTSWCKQIIGLCLTAFLQTTILVAGLITFNDSMILGIGLMISATEIPRIAGSFGLDTSTRANMMGAFYTAQGAVNITKAVTKVISKDMK